MKKYALVGKNLTDSLSPVVHKSFSCEYDILDVEECDLETTLQLPYDGFNITAPYKEIVAKYCDTKEQFINTIVKTNDKMLGFNTDGYGFLKSLQNFKTDIKVDKIGFIGQGATAQHLSNLCKGSKTLNGRKLSEYDLNEFELLVNCTPHQHYSFDDIPSNILIMDLGYKDDTFIYNAKVNGNIAINGFSMLYYQAKESQRLWRKYND